MRVSAKRDSTFLTDLLTIRCADFRAVTALLRYQIWWQCEIVFSAMLFLINATELCADYRGFRVGEQSSRANSVSRAIRVLSRANPADPQLLCASVSYPPPARAPSRKELEPFRQACPACLFRGAHRFHRRCRLLFLSLFPRL